MRQGGITVAVIYCNRCGCENPSDRGACLRCFNLLHWPAQGNVCPNCGADVRTGQAVAVGAARKKTNWAPFAIGGAVLPLDDLAADYAANLREVARRVSAGLSESGPGPGGGS